MASKGSNMPDRKGGFRYEVCESPACFVCYNEIDGAIDKHFLQANRLVSLYFKVC